MTSNTDKPERPGAPDRKRRADRSKAADTRVRRRFGLHAIAKTLPKITKRALGRRGFAEADLLGAWAGIVGQEVAAHCLPRKLDRPRRGKEGSGTLTLRVDTGFALEIQHMEPQLLERINGYFGFRAVERLRLLQAPGPPPAPEPPPEAPIPPEAESALRARLGGVGDEDLKSALDRLGRALLQRQD